MNRPEYVTAQFEVNVDKLREFATEQLRGLDAAEVVEGFAELSAEEQTTARSLFESLKPRMLKLMAELWGSDPPPPPPPYGAIEMGPKIRLREDRPPITWETRNRNPFKPPRRL